MSIEVMTKARATAIQRDAEEALAAVAEKHGGTFTPKGGSLGSSFVTFKFEFALRGEGGVAETKEAENFRYRAKRFGFEPDDLGKTFKDRGHTFTIAGMAIRPCRRPVICYREDGKGFKWDVDAVLVLLGREKKAKPRLPLINHVVPDQKGND